MQVVDPRKGVADSQVTGLDAEVQAVNVQHETLPLDEALATLLALVGPVSRVYLHVAQEVCAESEPATAL